MPLLILLVLIFLVVGVGVVAAGLGSGMPPAAPDRDGALLPETPMRPDDVDGLRFSLSLRGYRMDEVDDVLDRLTAELAERDRQIEALHRRLGDAAQVSVPAEPGQGEPTGPDVGPTTEAR